MWLIVQRQQIHTVWQSADQCHFHISIVYCHWISVASILMVFHDSYTLQNGPPQSKQTTQQMAGWSVFWQDEINICNRYAAIVKENVFENFPAKAFVLSYLCIDLSLESSPSLVSFFPFSVFIRNILKEQKPLYSFSFFFLVSFFFSHSYFDSLVLSSIITYFAFPFKPDFLLKGGVVFDC